MDTPVDRTGAPLSLITVHAHPDDEASKGSATVARYADEGVRTSLVCCTGGEAGDILNPAVDTPEVRADLFRVRMQELENSAAAIGYSAVHLLGYHDSGMPDSDDNARPDNFWNAPIEEAVERLVRLIRLERPQVIVTYADDRKFYPHPDHIRVHEISLPAFEAAGDPRAFPSAGPAWQPSKLYYTGFSRSRVQALHDEYVRRGEESPYTHWFERELPDHAERFTTFVDVGDWLHRRRAALLAHRTQVDPEGFWMRLPDDAIRRVFPWDEYLLARSLVDTGVAEGDTEDDLFAGARADPPDPRPSGLVRRSGIGSRG
ncbi:MAG: mycothiol conjugate amidase Mca [Actinobacteria bacterium]|nr:mycothiol conjugate amidase Mca [Actinomycetota bacterium]